jgi:hypothetical protein
MNLCDAIRRQRWRDVMNEFDGRSCLVEERVV